MLTERESLANPLMQDDADPRSSTGSSERNLRIRLVGHGVLGDRTFPVKYSPILDGAITQEDFAEEIGRINARIAALRNVSTGGIIECGLLAAILCGICLVGVGGWKLSRNSKWEGIAEAVLGIILMVGGVIGRIRVMQRILEKVDRGLHSELPSILISLTDKYQSMGLFWSMETIDDEYGVRDSQGHYVRKVKSTFYLVLSRRESISRFSLNLTDQLPTTNDLTSNTTTDEPSGGSIRSGSNYAADQSFSPHAL